MAALYITSSEKGSGKTAICAGLGRLLMDRGKKVGFFKPVISDGKTTTAGTDGDAAFMNNLFSLNASADILSPVISSRGNLAGNIKETCAKAARNKDVVIIEGLSDQYWASGEIAEALDARVIIVEPYSPKLAKAVGEAKDDIGMSLLGVVVNKVPKNRLEQARNDASTAGVNILGVLPEDRALLAMTVGELSESIQGEILRGAGQSGELVENLMLGALVVDSGPEYFGRKDNKAVVLKSERPDMQMAAMETSTRCLVLTGDTPLNANVLERAEEKNIPIILSGDNAASVVATIEDTLANNRFHQENKLVRLTELLEEHSDTQAIYKGLGLTG